MESQQILVTHASRPMDKSLEAYMAWIIGLRLAYGHRRAMFTKAEWAAAWKEYWEEGSNY